MTAASVPPTALAEPRRRSGRRWPVFLAIGVFALVAGAVVGYFAGAPARNDLAQQRDDARTQVRALTDQLDTAEADLATTQGDLAASQGDLSTANAALVESQDAAAALATERDGLLAQVAGLANVARARAYFDMNWSDTYIKGLQQAGVSLASYDELLSLLGENMTIVQWVEGSDGFRAADAAVFATRDADLIMAWDAWLNSEAGTTESDAAWNEIMLRFDELMITKAEPG